MCDGFITLAQTDKGAAALISTSELIALSEPGVSCFLVPRWLPDNRGRNEGFQIQRLKNKLGDKSNASSEVEYRAAIGVQPAICGI